ncbi:hypothetical protein, partial [Geobacillus kaustophilus]
KSEGERFAAMGKCSSPAGMFTPRRRRLFDPERRRAGARQEEKRKRRVWLSKPNVLHPQGCLHPEGEGYLAEESQALELDISRYSKQNALLFRSVLKE